MDFVAFDFETADLENSSPCALGITLVRNNEITECKSFLINPMCDFNPWTFAVHGITPDMVSDAPLFCEIWPEIEHYFTDYPIVAHNFPFDYSVLLKVCAKYGISYPQDTSDHYCTLRIAKQNYVLDSYKLNSLCDYFGITLDNHHDAVCDSKACAEIMIRMINDAVCSIDKYENNFFAHAQYRISKLIFPVLEYDQIDIQFNEKNFACTGTIEGYSRDQVYDIITGLGGTINKTVIKNTDYLIVGLEDLSIVKSVYGKSEKIKKAEQLRADGGKIKIITANDFLIAVEETKATESVNNDYLELTKSLGLTPKTAKSPKKLRYRGIHSDEVVDCTVVGVVSESPKVIRVSIPGNEFDIALDYLKEMQISIPAQNSKQKSKDIDKTTVPKGQIDLLKIADDDCDNGQEPATAFTDDSVLEQIKQFINDDYLSSGTLSVRINKTQPNSIVYTALPSVYRTDVGEQLICKVKTNGKADKQYILFSDAYADKLKDLGIKYTSIPSDPSPRVNIDDFLFSCILETDKAKVFFQEILDSSFKSERFDCCSRYKECSAAGKCVHPDKIYATSCGYRKNLLKGKIFY